MNSRWYLTAGTATLMLAISTLAYLNLIPGGWFRSPWDKAMHCLLFGGLAFSLGAGVQPRWQALCWAIPLALAVADECAQSLSRYRTPDVLDFAADAVGILLAIKGRSLGARRRPSPAAT